MFRAGKFRVGNLVFLTPATGHRTHYEVPYDNRKDPFRL